MTLLTSSIINELVKLTARKKTIFFLLLAGLMPFAGLPIVMRVQSGFGITAVSPADYPITILNLMTLFILPLLMFMSVSDMFSGELGDRTIRSMLVRPVSRLKLYTSKLLAVFAVIAAQLVLGYLASVIASLFLPASPGGVLTGIGHAALGYAAAAIPMFALCAASVFVAQFFRNGSGALAICILLYAAAKLIAFFLPQVAEFSPTAYTDWHLLWLGSSVSSGKLTTIFSYLLGCGIVCYTLGYYLFDKKEA